MCRAFTVDWVPWKCFAVKHVFKDWLVLWFLLMLLWEMFIVYYGSNTLIKLTFFRLLEEGQPPEAKFQRNLGSPIQCHIRIFVNTTRNISVNTDELERRSTTQVCRVQR